MNPRRLLTASTIVLLTAFILAAGAWFVEAHAEHKQLKLKEAANRQLLADAKLRLAEQQKILDRLKTDPAFVEKVVRDGLKYAKPTEMIFRFED